VTTDTNARILDAATDCFCRMGFKKASVEAIAAAAGVGKGTVYLRCDSKEDLFYQTVHRELRSWTASMSQLIDPRVSANELLIRIAAADLVYIESHPLVRDLMFGVLHGQLPEWSDQYEQLRTLGRQHVIEILELGVHQGVFEPTIDVAATARVLQDMHFSAVLLQSRTPGELAETRRLQVAAFRLALRGLERR
jgi:TetR/AcrR family transcriptional repressor of uid operon